ncbi:hypothetical protein ACFQZ4_52660 [Catellatospora coxensis]|uniref:Uncharacterized protein n=1 Tax=Catellatospora coxensis TaxID=310354 RepID=A0A8J3PCI1_9ACTN|nr:hypothetical protein [Catellatospora coxensis]GIG10001.1 hypothetical protein Cco03nite_67010 [Catellatospora coxensis]
MTDELADRLDGLAADVAGLAPALDRTAPAPVAVDVPGRLSRLAGRVDHWQRTAWSGHQDAARRLDRELTELAHGVRAAGSAYRLTEQDRGGLV